MNIRVLLSIVLIATLFSCGGAEERKAVYFEKAKISMAAGDLDKARIELKNVLQIDPKYADAYYELGKVYELKKKYRKAIGSYLKAEELNPELLENQAKLGSFYLILMNDVDKAQEKIDFILSREPDNFDGLLLKASYLIKEKKTDQAISILVDILERDSNQIESAELLARIYMQEKRVDDAITVLDTTLATNKDNVRLNTFLASVLVANKNYNRAEVLYQSFLERNPNSGASYTNLAAFYHQRDDKLNAEKVLRQSIENNLDDEERILKLTTYLSVVKGNDAAITELKSIVAKNPGFGKIRLVLAELYLIENDKQSAIKIYKTAINDFSEEVTGIDARMGLAATFISNKEYDKANQIINEALLISPKDAKVNFIRAKLALNDKDLETAIISLRIVIKDTPENIEAFLLLAKIHELEGHKEQFNSILNQAYDQNKANPEGLLVLAKFYLTHDLTQAEKIIDYYNAVNEDDYEGLSIKAAILNQNKEGAEAYEIAVKLMDKFPEKENGYLQAIPYLAGKGDRVTAISNLEKGYAIVKENRKILILLTSLQNDEKQFDIIENRLKEEIKVKSEDTEIRILLAKVYLNQQKFKSAEKTLEDVIVIDSKNEESYLLLSQTYRTNNKLNESKSILITGSDSVPESLKIPFMLTSVYEVEKNYVKAIDLYRKMNRSHEDNIVVTNNLASMLTDYGNDKEDLQFAKSLSKKLISSGQPVFLDTVGWVYYRLGDYTKAIEYLLQVVDKEADVNVFNYHLGMAYKMNGNKEQAKTYLEKSVTSGKPFKQKNLAEAALKDL